MTWRAGSTKPCWPSSSSPAANSPSPSWAGNYDYQNKYFTDDVQYFCPATLDDALAAEMAKIAVDAYNALGCEGWGRVDVMLRASDNRPFLLEVNTSPGMTGHSLVPMAAKAVGIDYPDLCIEILRSARLKMAKPTAKAGV
jgi:D-alanine-D-alanine ligase